MLIGSNIVNFRAFERESIALFLYVAGRVLSEVGEVFLFVLPVTFSVKTRTCGIGVTSAIYAHRERCFGRG